MSDIITDEQLSDDHILRYTQRKRRAFVDKLTEEGFPTDTKDCSVMLTALADMDRAALGNKRIGANERLAAADALVAHAITELSNQFGGQNPFEGGETFQGEGKRVEQDKLPTIDTVPGETDVGITNENFESLVSRFED